MICFPQAVKHQLVNNCLSCGRVVCQQVGVLFFWGVVWLVNFLAVCLVSRLFGSTRRRGEGKSFHEFGYLTRWELEGSGID